MLKYLILNKSASIFPTLRKTAIWSTKLACCWLRLLCSVRLNVIRSGSLAPGNPVPAQWFHPFLSVTTLSKMVNSWKALYLLVLENYHSLFLGALNFDVELARRNQQYLPPKLMYSRARRISMHCSCLLENKLILFSDLLRSQTSLPSSPLGHFWHTGIHPLKTHIQIYCCLWNK